MKLRTLLCAFVCGAVVMLFASRVVSQNDAGLSDDELRRAVEQAASLSKYHKNLKSIRGKYEQTIQWWAAPGAEPKESTCLADTEWILGGRFMMQTFEGKWLDKSFEAIGILGYDKGAGQYNSVWMDTLGTKMLLSKGTLDDSGKAITMHGEYVDPVSGQTVKTRMIMQMPDRKGETSFEMYRTTSDGTEYKFLDLISKRKIVRGA